MDASYIFSSTKIIHLNVKILFLAGNKEICGFILRMAEKVD
jgi:hypothetical protein